MIPKKIYQTYRTPQPDFAIENIKTINPEYEYQFFNDSDCIELIKNFFGDEVLNAYLSMSKLQHRADLFRYCLLYTYGGVYIDIDIQLILPIDEIINLSENSKLITVKSAHQGTGLYQGFLISEPKNKIFLTLIEDMLKNPNPDDYGYHIKFFGAHLLKESNLNEFVLNSKVKLDDNNDYFLFKEIQYTYEKYGTVDKNNRFILCGNHHGYPFEGYTKCC
jgi:hypothetical protein